MKITWIWGGVWRLALAVTCASGVSAGLANLLHLGIVGAAVLGFVIGYASSFVVGREWPPYRIEP